ncbi:MAG: MarR family transcriptional regulator [Maribacter sp.]|uniref:MarR family winged helix-turn-helix transcriptional regulator n=1 Tax=Maribacter sp. TaxID=1897614 RepID=UPI00329950B9
MKTKEVHIDFERSIGPWLGRTMKLLDYHMHEALQSAGLDLTKEQMVVLKKLHQKDGLNQNELAFLTYRDKSSLARLLSKMERKKYIIRKQSTDDKRVNQVFLTKTGRATYLKTRPVIKKLINKMEQNISTEEKVQMIDLLQKVQVNFEPELTFNK